MRFGTSARVLTVAAAAAALLPVPSAFATAPGDNGTVKIHDASTGEELRRNEPQVCTFYLDAFGFDSGEKVNWRIEAWAPTAAVKGQEVEAGVLTLDAEGHGRTGDLELSDGHYKLFWNFEGEKGSAKHKVFWTDCEDDEQAGPGGPSQKPSPSAPAEEPPSSASPSTEPAAPAPATSPPAPSDGDLAETGNGAPVGLLAGTAIALVAAGGGLILWRRRSQV